MTEPAEVLYEGKYLRFMRRGSWEYAERKDCTGVVFIVAMTAERKIVLCEQYRVPVGRTIIEIPAGLVEDKAEFENETMETAARRELLEETGYEAETMTLLFQGPAAPGSSSAIIHFYLAGGIRKKGPGGGDETENIRVHEVALENADTWLRGMEAAGHLIDPKVFSALHLLQSRIFNPGENA
ncbi:MAG: NUDIX hydrolase [Candidatus Omnitrophica bacterium]|nr:NUDIX hydrolase [Candidatus Omnitrophota bacterium]